METVESRKGLTGNQLKLIAIIAMTVDHVTWLLFPGLNTTWYIYPMNSLRQESWPCTSKRLGRTEQCIETLKSAIASSGIVELSSGETSASLIVCEAPFLPAFCVQIIARQVLHIRQR